jgi:hypothetical protein
MAMIAVLYRFLPFFYLLVRKTSDASSALIAMGIYTLTPLSIFASRSFMPDMASLSLSITALYLFVRWLDRAPDATLFAAILVKPPAVTGWLLHWWVLAMGSFVVIAGEGNYRHEWYQLSFVPAASYTVDALETTRIPRVAITDPPLVPHGLCGAALPPRAYPGSPQAPGSPLPDHVSTGGLAR